MLNGKLGETILRVGILGIALWLGFDLTPEVASELAVAADFGLSALKKK